MRTMSKTNESLHKYQKDYTAPAMDIFENAVSTGIVQPNDFNVLHTDETNTSVHNNN